MDPQSENERLEEVSENSPLIDKIASENTEKVHANNVALVPPNNHRRSDEPTELSFEKCMIHRSIICYYISLGLCLCFSNADVLLIFQFLKTMKRNTSESKSRTRWTTLKRHWTNGGNLLNQSMGSLTVIIELKRNNL
jgi:hypothetical protein